MKKILLIFIVISLGFTANLFACEFPEINFDADFSAARLSSCSMRNEDSYLLTIKPENHPINDSPWYAFKVIAKEKRTIIINVEFVNGNPRYQPKTSRDGILWQPIRFKVKNDRLVFKLDVDQQPLWVAGQEIINNEVYSSWLKSMQDRSQFKLETLGRSTENRPIYSMQSLSPSNEWVVVLGRMHPPEITGALALFPFSQELLFNDKIGRQFRQRFNLLLIPNLNPDGVEHGHWRHNINGVDLNRDWKNFEQKETLLVKSKLDSITDNGGKIVFAIDFHSTAKDIFYTMPTDYGLSPALLVEEWLSELDNKTPDFTVRVKPGNNPDMGVFKQFIADTYGVHAITYEMGDNTSRKKINSVAKVAASTLMEKLLATSKLQFYGNKPKSH